jgi:hypothetical protein
MLPFALVRHANGKSRTPMPGAPENARRGCRVLQGKIAWSRYDIDTNSLLLAEWLVPDFPRAARGASKLQWLGGPHEPLSEVR